MLLGVDFQVAAVALRGSPRSHRVIEPGRQVLVVGDWIALTTKGDNQVWTYTVATQTLAITTYEVTGPFFSIL